MTESTSLVFEPTQSSWLGELVQVMEALRQKCPWCAQQTHRSLVTFLVEETCELIEAIESGSVDDLIEELGDLLFQVYFHCGIASEEALFDIEQVAQRICEKLVVRHPYVWAGEELPQDLESSWEQRKGRLKNRTSCLDGIPSRLSALTRAAKVFYRAKSHQVDFEIPKLDTENLADVDCKDSAELSRKIGEQILALVALGQANGIDVEQLTRDALRQLESEILLAENPSK